VSCADCIHNPNLFIVSGGPGTGKTTVLRELAKLGLRYAPEAARQIIREQASAGGTALPWMDRRAYCELMLQRSIERFEQHTPAAQATLSDRGIPDTLCYARLIGLQATEFIENACRRYRYARPVFVAPPWKEIYHTDAERKQDFAEGERTYSLMLDVYRELGYECVELPKGTPSERAQFIVKQLDSR
jgi:predicted ATPase